MKEYQSGMRKFYGVAMVATAVIVPLFAGSPVWAQSITMSYVTVGNPGNAADPATGSLYGSVSYTYDIGEYDVTDSQYCTFLNDVDPTGANTLALYTPGGDAQYPEENAEFGISYNSEAASGSKYSVISGYGSMPVVGVDYWDTLRFANYLDDGTTESGAYSLVGGNSDGYGTPSNASSLLAISHPNAGASVWLPNENEWYKAAYYDPATGLYSVYATQSDTAPGNIIGNGTNEANYYTGNGWSVTQSSSYDSSQNYLTAVGSFTGSASYYGTYDQSGDVYNWSTAVLGSEDYLVLRGGIFDAGAGLMSSSYSASTTPLGGSSNLGFRVASVAAVPEPSTWVMTAAGVGTLLGFRRRVDRTHQLFPFASMGLGSRHTCPK